MTPTVRLELTTPGLEVRCAIQLRHDGGSYLSTIFYAFKPLIFILSNPKYLFLYFLLLVI